MTVVELAEPPVLDRRRIVARLTDYLLPGAYIVATTLFGARIFEQTLPVSRYALYAQLLILLIYFGKAVRHAHFGVASSFIAIVVYILFCHWRFSDLSGTAPIYSAMASYLPVLSFLVFTECRLPLRSVLATIATISLVYLIVYVLGHSYLLRVNQSSGVGVLPADGARSARLYLLAAWASFAVFHGYLGRNLQPAYRAALVLFGLAALILSNSRTYQLIFMIVGVATVLGRTGLMLRLGIFVSFVVLTLTMLAGLMVPGWNPYSYMAWDSSAAFRSVEYTRALIGIGQHWLLGVGITADSAVMAKFLHAGRYDLMFSSDLGSVGVMLMMGVPGLLALTGVIWFCTVQTNDRYRQPGIQALQLNCLVSAACAWLTPMLVLEATAIFLGVLVAVRVRAHRQTQREAWVEGRMAASDIHAGGPAGS
jgi:hypothetical protein